MALSLSYLHNLNITAQLPTPYTHTNTYLDKELATLILSMMLVPHSSTTVKFAVIQI